VVLNERERRKKVISGWRMRRGGKERSFGDGECPSVRSSGLGGVGNA